MKQPVLKGIVDGELLKNKYGSLKGFIQVNYKKQDHQRMYNNLKRYCREYTSIDTLIEQRIPLVYIKSMVSSEQMKYIEKQTFIDIKDGEYYVINKKVAHEMYNRAKPDMTIWEFYGYASEKSLHNASYRPSKGLTFKKKYGFSDYRLLALNQFEQSTLKERLLKPKDTK